MITIPKDIFDQIMTTLGCPFVTYAPNSEDVSNYDLELNEDQIKNNLIAPVFKEYFRWFPIEDYTNITVSQNFEIDFPDASTFSVKDVRLSTKTLQYAPTTNPFVNQCFIRNATGSYGYGMYGTRNNYGFTRSQIYRDIEMQSYIDKAKTFKWRVLKNQRKIVGYSNIEGAVEITWAKLSDDWDYIAFEQQQDVIDLCQGKLLKYFGHLRKQSENPNVPIELNGDDMIEQGKELEDKVYEKWHNMSVPVIMRG